MADTQKPRQTSPKGKVHKRNESQESAHAARQRKRDNKRKGLKAGSRQAVEQETSGIKSGSGSKDPRVGSRKPVALVVEPAKKPVAAKPAKAVKTAEQIAEQQAKQLQLKLEQELAAIENDERLNLLLDRLDDGLSVSADDEAWLDARLARHQELLVALGMDDDDDDVAEPASPDDLLQRFINDDFDPSEIDPEYKPSKK
ncbi:MAG: GTPase-activating protein [Aeromonadaceae bacterium]|nr:GTPase-activating protein [Aeromonadaceae bacterium]